MLCTCDNNSSPYNYAHFVAATIQYEPRPRLWTTVDLQNSRRFVLWLNLSPLQFSLLFVLGFTCDLPSEFFACICRPCFAILLPVAWRCRPVIVLYRYFRLIYCRQLPQQVQWNKVMRRSCADVTMSFHYQAV